MPISYNQNTGVFSLTTKNALYQMKKDALGVLLHLYFGENTHQDMSYLVRTADRGFCGNYYERRDVRDYSPDQLPQEYAGYGTGDYRLSSVQVIDGAGSRSVDLRFSGCRIIKDREFSQQLPYVRPEGKAEYLEITLCDAYAGMTVRLLYGVFYDLDIITRSAVIGNSGKTKLILNKAASACLDFQHVDLDVIHFHGRACMERLPERIPIPVGVVSFGSRRGHSSHQSNPFIILCPHDTTEARGSCYGAMLMYSGGHLEELEKDQAGGIRLVTGIQPDGFCWSLLPGEEFETPEAILAFSNDGLNGLSTCYHQLIREHIIPKEFRNRRPPILINSWEACYFDFDRQKTLDLAVEASRLGIELFVLDDGWFGHRNDDNSSLGDWTVNQEKLGGTLADLSDQLHSLGLQFGLWFEPEMISEDSELFRAHPDWALCDPERKPVLSRNQLVLDMSREDVVDYLYQSMCAILDHARIEYIKWDFNRALANVYSHALPADRQGETAHRFMQGTYRLLRMLRARYPELLIEGCAGGGGRFDAGMLFFSPQIWCSDDTDPIERLEIQNGTSYGYPSHTMGAHVSASPNHQTGKETPIATRGLVAQCGAFGYELDLCKLTEGEKTQIREQINTYKRYAQLLMHGRYYRLIEASQQKDYATWMLVSPDKMEALVQLVMTHVRANAVFPYIRLQGLDPDMEYILESTGEVFTGAALMLGGYAFEQLRGDYPGIQLHLIRKQ